VPSPETAVCTEVRDETVGAERTRRELFDVMLDIVGGERTRPWVLMDVMLDIVGGGRTMPIAAGRK